MASKRASVCTFMAVQQAKSLGIDQQGFRPHPPPSPPPPQAASTPSSGNTNVSTSSFLDSIPMSAQGTSNQIEHNLFKMPQKQNSLGAWICLGA
jgi:hypothetical protein